MRKFIRHYITEVPEVHICEGVVCVDFIQEDVHSAMSPHIALAYAQKLFKIASEQISGGGEVIELRRSANGK